MTSFAPASLLVSLPAQAQCAGQMSTQLSRPRTLRCTAAALLAKLGSTLQPQVSTKQVGNPALRACGNAMSLRRTTAHAACAPVSAAYSRRNASALCSVSGDSNAAATLTWPHCSTAPSDARRPGPAERARSSCMPAGGSCSSRIASACNTLLPTTATAALAPRPATQHRVSHSGL